MRKTWIGILAAFIVIAVSWIGNISFFQAHQLGDSIFLEHRIEVLNEGGDSFFLYYLEDAQGKKIRTIAFPQHPELSIETHDAEYMRYTRQHLGRFLVSIQPHSNNKEAKMSLEPAVIDKVLVQYDDGSTAEQNIGEIRFIDPFEHGKKEAPISGTSSGSSSDGTGYGHFNVARSAELHSMESNYMSIMDTIQLSFHFDYRLPEIRSGIRSTGNGSNAMNTPGTPLEQLELPIQLAKGDSFYVSYQTNPDDPEKVFELRLQLVFKESSKEQWIEYMFIGSNQPYFTEAQVRSLVREKRKQP
ncbi:hypothetical protein [Paenibacillus faecalis]|uniref:hypothetical protein n=1 Tax=Paenibacillus faecalis TaxID=2079532 RepID=UPI000D0EB77A|nr:hypothetical protein [Paenibacillus faecalis]